MTVPCRVKTRAGPTRTKKAERGSGDTRSGSATRRTEYEAINGSNRLTFPNDGYDQLKITPHIADG